MQPPANRRIQPSHAPPEPTVISYVIPTRDRQPTLSRTLAAIEALPPHPAEVILVDNASSIPPAAPIRLANGIPVTLLFRPTNEGAAARNIGVEASDRSSSWVVMLDDDSAPIDTKFIAALRDQPADVAAVAAEIFVPSPSPMRESGGLPEVFIGCGVAIRRDVFLETGGYDASFGYYAEEYDLAARILVMGGRVTLDRRFRVRHEKTSAGRDMNLILRRLVRNNGWVAQRYAPPDERRFEVREILSRYARIAAKEKAITGYTAGAAELIATLSSQPRTPMPHDLFARFTGLYEARASLAGAWNRERFDSAAVVDHGKHSRLVERALQELGVRIVDESDDPEALVIGTLSPGPLLDAWERRVALGPHRRIESPWASLVTPASSDLAATAV